MSDETLTPLEISRAKTGRRFWKMRAQAYPAFNASLNQKRGYPTSPGSTLRALHPAENMPIATDGTGQILVNLAVWFVAGDSPLENSPWVEELTSEQYENLKPEDQEVKDL